MASDAAKSRQFVACDQCGRPFEHEVRYPVTTREDDTGTLRLYSFCDEACQDEWGAEH